MRPSSILICKHQHHQNLLFHIFVWYGFRYGIDLEEEKNIFLKFLFIRASAPTETSMIAIQARAYKGNTLLLGAIVQIGMKYEL